MRYICFKKIVTKIFDEILDDKTEVLALLNNLKEKEITCSVQIRCGMEHEGARILDVGEDEFTWRLIKNGVSLKQSTLIADIKRISVMTDDEITAKIKPNPSRWSTLDLDA